MFTATGSSLRQVVPQVVLSLAFLASLSAVAMGCAVPATEGAVDTTEEAFTFLDGDLSVALVSKKVNFELLAGGVGSALTATMKITNVGGLDSPAGHVKVECSRLSLDTSEAAGQTEYDGGFAIPAIAPDHVVTVTHVCEAKAGWRATGMRVTLPKDATPTNNTLNVGA